jgi:hypothetical protein
VVLRASTPVLQSCINGVTIVVVLVNLLWQVFPHVPRGRMHSPIPVSKCMHDFSILELSVRELAYSEQRISTMQVQCTFSAV